MSQRIEPSVPSHNVASFSAPGPTTTLLAVTRTDLAVTRTYLATVRTLQAWVRTAVSMISFGFTIGKLGEAAKDMAVTSPIFGHEWSIGSLAYTLVTMGTVALAVASVDYWVAVRELRTLGLKKRLGLVFFVAITFALIGVFALSALVLQL
jgi:putative membrane protein